MDGVEQLLSTALVLHLLPPVHLERAAMAVAAMAFVLMAGAAPR